MKKRFIVTVAMVTAAFSISAFIVGNSLIFFLLLFHTL